MNVYLYPDNLSAKPIVWFWELTDIAMIGIGGILSFAALAILNFSAPVIFCFVYAFISMRIADTSVIDYLTKACGYFLWGQQYFEWEK